MRSDPRLRAAFYYGLPMLFCLAVHWLALKTWFYLDDFAWLGLPQQLNKPADLIHILFRPEAQGTVRTLSERLYFLVFSSAFGLHFQPFRIWAFLTQFANIVLLVWITRRLTSCAIAGFLAPVIWSANAGLAMALGWSSAYNEIAFAFFVLLAFHLFLRYIDTGERKYWLWQWTVFLLGFGALETNVMYPALAAGYALCCARPYFRRTLYLFIPALLFTAAHFLFIPPSSDPLYTMYFGSSLFTTLWTYWAFTVGAVRDAQKDWRPLWLGLTAVLSVTAALGVFALHKLRRGNWLPIFLLAWFVITILPVLTLKDHFTEYYVCVPAIGVAMLGAWAVAEARSFSRLLAFALAGLYFVVSISDLRTAERFNYVRALRVKWLVQGVDSLPKPQSGEKILLAGIDNDLFWTALDPNPFRLIGITQVYLAPGSEQQIDPHPEWGGISRFIINPGETLLALKQHRAAVLQLEGPQLRDVTDDYLPRLQQRFGREVDFVDVADPEYASRLGPGWYPAEAGFRWTAKAAVVKIAGPKTSGQMLKIRGFCPAVAVARGPLQVTFRTGRVAIGTATLKEPDQQFDLQFQLPPELISTSQAGASPLTGSSLAGPSMINVEIEVSRTAQVANDTRILGLAFGTFTLE